MNLNTLNGFRHGMYGCFGNGKDALFNLVDALSSEAGAQFSRIVALALL